MPFTRIEDVVVPEIFNPYVIERTAELSAIRSSGIMASIPGIEIPPSGRTVNLPYWNDINGDDEVFTDEGETTPDKLTADNDIAVILTRIKSWSSHDLSATFAGSDPLRAAGDLVAAYWARKEQKTLLAILKGVFASAAMTDSILDISEEEDGAELISNDSLVDAISLLGDAGGSLTGILCHSAVMYNLAKKRLLDLKPTEPGTTSMPEFQSYLGRRIIADDGAPVEGASEKIYTTYLFGAGAIGYAEGSPNRPVEFDREAKASQDVLIHRRLFIMHPRGVKWVGSATKATPSNVELAKGTSWERVYEQKNIRIVALKHKLG